MKLSKHAIDWTGCRVGNLMVTRPLRVTKGQVVWEVRCDCGQVKESTSGFLTKRKNRGIAVCDAHCEFADKGNRVTHGAHQTPEYLAWRRMLGRCYNQNNPSYSRYGPRGITVCDEWRTDFAKFFQDMGPMPRGFSLERRDNDKGYYAENCEWASAKTQANNRSSNVIISTPWGEMNIQQAADRAGIPSSILYQRVYAGLPYEKLFAKPKAINVLWDTEWGQLTVVQASEKAGIKPKTAWARIKRGLINPKEIFSNHHLTA